MNMQEKHILVHNMPQDYIGREVTERGILYCIADNLANTKLASFLIGDLYQVKLRIVDKCSSGICINLGCNF